MEKLNSLFEIAGLIAKEKSTSLSNSEAEILQNWLAKNERNKEIYIKLQNGENLINELNELKKFDEHKAFRKVEQRILKERRKLNFFRIVPGYMKYAAAAAILIFCSYLIISTINKGESNQYAQSTIVPGKHKAILIIANNQEILLDSSDKKQIIINELADIVQSGSTLCYNKNDSSANRKGVTEFNTLITPRGGEYTLVLSDGTEIMLNSGSKLIYPVVFNETRREVVLEGEAFFKVTKSNKTPFIVKADNVIVTVYGTLFNVSAYNNETLVQTTLVEGSVGVSINNNKSVSDIKLKPGQQLTYNKGSASTETKEVNTEQYTAWTKGMFVFENEPIENILNAMSRWYDFEFEFKDDNIKKQRFTLSLGKYDNVSKILDMISISSNVRFSTKNNTIMVFSE
jgi:ferric-dicitrate binding protein FerR (iron transport regulator)